MKKLEAKVMMMVKTRIASSRGEDENLPALEASCLRGALPPVDLRAVCLVRAIVDECCEDVNEVGDVDEVVDGCGGGRLKCGCVMQKEKSREGAGGGNPLYLWL